MQPADLHERAAARGVLSGAVLRASGTSENAVRWRVSAGDLRRLHRGVFVDARTPLTPERRAWAAAVAGGGAAVPSHLTAAGVHGLWLPSGYTGSPAEVVRADEMPRSRRTDLVQSRARLGAEDVVRIEGGLAVTSPLRTVADVERRYGCVAAVIAAESAVRRGLVVPGDVGNVLRPTTVALVEPASQSPLETTIRLLLHHGGIRHLVAQYAVWDDQVGCMRYIDLADPTRLVAIEADGRTAHDDPDALYVDRQRQNVLVLGGWVVLRFTWSDVRRRPGYVLATVRRALARAA